MRIFYSWQSDLPSATTRGLIMAALEHAKTELAKGGVVVEIDQDARGEAGSPEVAATIFEKICAADVFVGDVSIIGSANGRPTPNPNVLTEVGFAAGVLRWSRVVLIANTAHGRIEELPFDLRSRKVIAYTTENAQKTRVDMQKSLGHRLAQQLSGIPNSTDPPLVLRALEGERVRDRTLDRKVTKALNLRAMSAVLGWNLDDDELMITQEDLNAFAERLRLLPIRAAELLAIIISRQQQTRGLALVDDVRLATELDYEEFHTLLNLLITSDFISVEQDENNHSRIQCRQLKSGWTFLDDLGKVAKKLKFDVATVIVDLNFGVLDTASHEANATDV